MKLRSGRETGRKYHQTSESIKHYLKEMISMSVEERLQKLDSVKKKYSSSPQEKPEKLPKVASRVVSDCRGSSRSVMSLHLVGDRFTILAGDNICHRYLDHHIPKGVLKKVTPEKVWGNHYFRDVLVEWCKQHGVGLNPYVIQARFDDERYSKLMASGLRV